MGGRRPPANLHEIIYLNAKGYLPEQIAEKVGYSPAHISRLIWKTGADTNHRPVIEKEWNAWENRPERSYLIGQFYKKQRKGAKAALEMMNA